MYMKGGVNKGTKIKKTKKITRDFRKLYFYKHIFNSRMENEKYYESQRNK